MRGRIKNYKSHTYRENTVLRKYLFVAILAILPSFAFATWQLAGEPIRTPGAKPLDFVNNIPAYFQTNPYYTLYPKRGPLFSTVYTYATDRYWKLRWLAKRNYHINNEVPFAGSSFKTVLDRLLAHYPLKAYYNTQRKIVTIRHAGK